ncbi:MULTISPECIES: DUF6924 domain-containing protein [Streptomyces]|uniref:DUF6924 domain-containing protein n=1 Tax=Streptomyces canarius TaxID=285453 RepID=A0ABQ3D9F7_9ACTN|nr:hypothetical protein [Streptomyces canarius]GHA68416.1 hypothetical protein GCM10010345_85110 [Streptomyces canarius]
MRTLAGIDDRDDLDALVIRTDYDDPEAWHAVLEALTRPADGDEPETPFVIDDPSWAGASTDEVREAVRAHEHLREYLGTAFIADRTTMRGPHHALLAVLTSSREDFEDAEDWESTIEFGTEFRVVPVGVNVVHANLDVANTDFEEFAEAAQDAPDGVLNWWQD